MNYECSDREQHSFPTRRSSDLAATATVGWLLRFRNRCQLLASVGSGGVLSAGRVGKAAQHRVNQLSHRNRRSEEHTSELQSRGHLVCRLLLEKKKKEDN